MGTRAYLLAWKPHVTRSWIISERGGIQARPSDEGIVREVQVRQGIPAGEGTSPHQNAGGPRLGSGFYYEYRLASF